MIGFASLPEQVHRKAVKRGFDFTLMVVGELGVFIMSENDDSVLYFVARNNVRSLHFTRKTSEESNMA